MFTGEILLLCLLGLDDRLLGDADRVQEEVELPHRGGVRHEAWQGVQGQDQDCPSAWGADQTGQFPTFSILDILPFSNHITSYRSSWSRWMSAKMCQRPNASCTKSWSQLLRIQLSAGDAVFVEKNVSPHSQYICTYRASFISSTIGDVRIWFLPGTILRNSATLLMLKFLT